LLETLGALNAEMKTAADDDDDGNDEDN